MADSRNGAGNCSRLYELNTCIWHYGRGQPCRVTVAEAKLQRKAATSDACTRAAETLKRHREERGADYYYSTKSQEEGDGSASY